MVLWIVNWRRNVFMSLLFLLVIGSFSYQTKQLCVGWWVEQQRLGDCGLQVVRRPMVVPAWYCSFESLLYYLRVKARDDLIIRAMLFILAISGAVWLCVLRCIIMEMMSKGANPRQFSWVWESPLFKASSTLEIRVMVSVLPDLRREGSYVQNLMSNETIMHGSEIVLDDRPVILALLPTASVPGEKPDEERMECLKAIPAETNGSQVVEGPTFGVSAEELAPECYRVTSIVDYSSPIEQEEMKKFYVTLSEKDKRRYAAIEAFKLGHGGRVYIAEVLGCSRKTVSKGIQELKNFPEHSGFEPRIRKPGGGRKRYDVIHPGIDEKFLDVLNRYTAGDPMREVILWTNLTHKEIVEQLGEKHSIWVSTKVIRQLLKKHNYRRRKAQKKQTMKQVLYRNEQFENIARLKAKYEAVGNPVISMDTKKKEYLGNFYRDGHLYTQQEIHTYDHDFISFADGIIIPHGIYDYERNTGYVNLGTSKDTSEFACDSLKNWWHNQGQYAYPHATSILILCDGGGSNGSRQYLFKEDLQKLSDEIGIEIRIAHYPPYTSKYNPIEHRLFPHLTRACQGVIFKNAQLVKELMEKTKTSKGLKVTVQIIDKVYETGRKVAQGFKENLRIAFDKFLPLWSYRAIPNGQVI